MVDFKLNRRIHAGFNQLVIHGKRVRSQRVFVNAEVHFGAILK